MEDIECPVCLDYFSLKGVIKCPICHYELCFGCFTQYLLMTLTEPKCMNTECNVRYTFKTLLLLLPPSWMKTKYRNQLSGVLLEREKAKIPETLELIRFEKEGVIKKDYKIEYISNCPTKECKGMIEKRIDDLLINNVEPNPYVCKCVLCNVIMCEKCFNITNPKGKGKEMHKCKDSDVESVKMIKKETKVCPNLKCSARIYKISGCDQMWCTDCRTAFSWNHGTIETGTIHNPHAIQWYLKNGKSKDPRLLGNGGLGEGQCRLLDGHVIYRLNMYPYEALILSIYSTVAQIDEKINDDRRFIVLKRDHIRLLRREWVLNKISDNSFSDKILKDEEDIRTSQERKDILSVLYINGIDQFKILYDNNSNIKNTNLKWARNANQFFVDTMERLRLFTNETLRGELELLEAKYIPQIEIKNGEWKWNERR